MQDLQTGAMVPIDPVFLEGIENLEAQSPFMRLDAVNERLQKAKDEAIPQRENQGPIFAVGEELEIRGGKFRVHAISGKRLYLDSIPLNR